jgi:hypothetical protein
MAPKRWEIKTNNLKKKLCTERVTENWQVFSFG